jgi:hypothetical protein
MLSMDYIIYGKMKEFAFDQGLDILSSLAFIVRWSIGGTVVSAMVHTV